jgi:hypothetical protein
MMLSFSKSAALAAAVGALTLTAPAAFGQTWDAAADLLANEKPDGGAQELANPNATVPQWSYGYRETAGGAALTLFSAAAGEHTNAILGNESLEGWASPAGAFTIPFVYVDVTQADPAGLGMHPANEGDARTYDVVRWTAPTAGTYDVAATWQDADAGGGSGAEAFVVLNGTSVAGFNGAFPNGGSAAYDDNALVLSAGDTLDFVLGPGANGDFGNDSTTFNADIALVPEPGAIGLLGAGALLALRRRRRRGAGCHS